MPGCKSTMKIVFPEIKQFGLCESVMSKITFVSEQSLALALARADSTRSALRSVPLRRALQGDCFAPRRRWAGERDWRTVRKRTQTPQTLGRGLCYRRFQMMQRPQGRVRGLCSVLVHFSRWLWGKPRDSDGLKAEVGRLALQRATQDRCQAWQSTSGPVTNVCLCFTAL